MNYHGIEYECYVIEEEETFFGVCAFISFEEYTYVIKKIIHPKKSTVSQAEKELCIFAKQYIDFNLC